jgi:hypothetical protein
MARAGATTAILRTCTVSELRVVRNELCEKVQPYDGDKDDFINRLRRSIDTRDVAHDDLIEVICSVQSKRRVTTRIEERIQDLEFSNNAHHRGLEERPLISELFQALRYQFRQDENYEVYDEYRPKADRRLQPDLCVKQTNSESLYLTEVKTPTAMNTLLNKLSRYNDKLSYNKLYVCYITDRQKRLPSKNSKIGKALSDAQNKYGADVLKKGPQSFRKNNSL